MSPRGLRPPRSPLHPSSTAQLTGAISHLSQLRRQIGVITQLRLVGVHLGRAPSSGHASANFPKQDFPTRFTQQRRGTWQINPKFSGWEARSGFVAIDIYSRTRLLAARKVSSRNDSLHPRLILHLHPVSRCGCSVPAAVMGQRERRAVTGPTQRLFRSSSVSLHLNTRQPLWTSHFRTDV